MTDGRILRKDLLAIYRWTQPEDHTIHLQLIHKETTTMAMFCTTILIRTMGDQVRMLLTGMLGKLQELMLVLTRTPLQVAVIQKPVPRIFV